MKIKEVIIGTDGNDILIGEDGSQIIIGAEGDDILIGGEGDDKLIGGDGDDLLFGNGGDDKLIGGDGDDTGTGGSGSDVYLAGSGNDIGVYDFSINNDGDYLDYYNGGSNGAEGDTFRLVITGDELLALGIGEGITDTEKIADAKAQIEFLFNSNIGGLIDLSVLGINLVLRNFEKIEIVSGSVVIGTPGDDILVGAEGDDRFLPGAGNDSIDGKAGTDTLDYSTDIAGINLDFTIDTASGTAIGTDTFTSIEIFLLGSGDDTTTFGTTFGSADGAIIKMGLGTNTVDASNLAAPITISYNSDPVLTSGSESTTIADADTLLFSDTNDDTVIINNPSSIDNVTIWMGEDGVLDNDIVDANGLVVPATLTFNVGPEESLTAGGRTIKIADAEEWILSDAQNDDVVVNDIESNDVRVDAGEILAGGDIDSMNAAGLVAAATVTIATGDDNISTSPTQSLAFDGIEDIQLSATNEDAVIVQAIETDDVRIDAGESVLGPEIDSMDASGLAAAAVVTVKTGDNSISTSPTQSLAFDGIEEIVLSDTNDDNLVVQDIKSDDMQIDLGDALSDNDTVNTSTLAAATTVITLQAGADTFSDGSNTIAIDGAESWTTAASDDTTLFIATLATSDDGSSFDLGTGSGSDVVNASSLSSNLIYNAITNVFTDSITTLTVIGAETVTFGSGNDTFVGGSSDEIVDGSAGNDAIEGGAGADTLDGGAGIDLLSYASSPTFVQVDLLNIFGPPLGGDANGDIIVLSTPTLSTFENMLGTAFHDALLGDDGDNVIEGGPGMDGMDGRDGNDTISYASDTFGVIVDLNVILQAAQLGSHAHFNALWNFENIIGGSGNDTLTGDGNANEIEGGDGDDILDGGAGLDTFIFNITDTGADILNSFIQTEDQLDFRSYELTDINDLSIFINGGNSEVSVGADLVVTVTGIIGLVEADFMF